VPSRALAPSVRLCVTAAQYRSNPCVFASAPNAGYIAPTDERKDVLKQQSPALRGLEGLADVGRISNLWQRDLAALDPFYRLLRNWQPSTHPHSFGLKMLWGCVRTTCPQGDLLRAGRHPSRRPVRPRPATQATPGGAPRKSLYWPTAVGQGGLQPITPKTASTSLGGRLYSPGDGAIPMHLTGRGGRGSRTAGEHQNQRASHPLALLPSVTV
jgi:hypothetical protein